MADKPRWEVPSAQQPRAEELEFDLEATLKAVLSLSAEVPETAFTASILGTQRSGSGVLISEDGLVLTIGYLVTEAENVWLKSSNGRVVPAHPIAVDQESGFALVQAMGKIDATPIKLGRSRNADVGEPVIVAGGGGLAQAVRARIVAKQEFAGYWEYYLEEAIFTGPAHPLWGGAALIGADGSLLGVGSLHVQHANGRGESEDINMIVPIDLLPPVLDDLRKLGRSKKPARPWLGVYSTENDGRVVVTDVTEEAPAGIAGLRAGDIITSVRDRGVDSLADFYREVWACGPAGAEIPIEIVRDKRTLWLRIKSADRMSYMKKPRFN